MEESKKPTGFRIDHGLLGAIIKALPKAIQPVHAADETQYPHVFGSFPQGK